MKLRTKLSALVLAGCMATSLVPAAFAADDDDSLANGGSLANYDEYVLTKETIYTGKGESLTKTYTYNSHGDLISEIPSVVTSDFWKVTYEYDYDALGNKTSQKKFINDALSEKTINEYNGRDLTSSSTGNDEYFWSKTKYSYTENEIKAVEYDAADNLASTTVTVLDDFGNVLSRTKTYPDGSMRSQDTYSYNEAGLMTKHNTIDNSNGNSINSFTEIDYKRDNNGNLIYAGVTSGGQLKSYYELSYNDKNVLESIRWSGAGDSPRWLQIYDANGNKIAEYYRFDDNGNPIKDEDCNTCEYAKLSDLLKDTVKDSFNDVKTDEYFATPILWAVNNGITNGMGDNKFEPNTNCTRGQIVTFLWRMAGQPEPASTSNPFTDVDVNAYYGKAVLWAVENGITTGMTKTTFEPNRTCTRGQTVTFIWRADGEPNAETSTSFTDVDTNAYYGKAVLWAVDNEVTNGMGDNKFAPETTCTRGHIVTFLYRAFAE